MHPAQLTILLVLLSIPLLDIVGILIVGRLIGLWPTIGLLLTAALCGGLVLRSQSRAVIQALLDEPRRIFAEPAAVADSVALLAAGGLLIFPGFLSDLIAIVLLIPATRHAVVHLLARDAEAQSAASAVPDADPDEASRDGPVIDGDFRRVSERPLDPPRNRHERH